MAVALGLDGQMIFSMSEYTDSLFQPKCKASMFGFYTLLPCICLCGLTKGNTGK